MWSHSVFSCLCNRLHLKYCFYHPHKVTLSLVLVRNLGLNLNSPSSMISSHEGFVLQSRFLSLKTSYLFSSTKSNAGSGSVKGGNELTKPKKPKKEIKTYITLLGVDNSYSVTTVEEAKRLAERRHLKLVKIVDFDPKTDRAVYQLMTEAKYLKEDSEWGDSKTGREKSVKGDKLVSLSCNTSEYDVLTKTKMIKKWLSKNLEVRAVITGDSTNGENVFKIIVREIGNDGRILQKRVKGTDIRFQILPPKKSEVKDSVSDIGNKK